MLCYVPVLHEGYRRFLCDNSYIDRLYILGKSITEKYRPLQKDLRALDPRLAARSLSAWNLPFEINVIEDSALTDLAHEEGIELFIPEDFVADDLMKKHFPGHRSTVLKKHFLRWNEFNIATHQKVLNDCEITEKEFLEYLLKCGIEEAIKSPDLWRLVGSLIIKNDEIVISAHNRIVPTEETLYYEGDPRGHSKKGKDIDLSIAAHSERYAISQAARRGIATEGCELFVTTFPCVPCAYAIKDAGFKKIYYVEGYTQLDVAKKIFTDQGIEIVQVITSE